MLLLFQCRSIFVSLKLIAISTFRLPEFSRFIESSSLNASANRGETKTKKEVEGEKKIRARWWSFVVLCVRGG